MSRKLKRKGHRRRRRRTFNPNKLDRHHLLWISSKWTGYWAKRLRLHEYCIVEIPQYTLHKYIHMEMSEIPVPLEALSRAALERLEQDLVNNTISMKDPPAKRLEWLLEQFNGRSPATANALKHELRIVQKFEGGD